MDERRSQRTKEEERLIGFNDTQDSSDPMLASSSVTPPLSGWRRIVAISTVVVIATLFAVNSELIQAESSKVQPYFLIWLCHCAGSVFALVHRIKFARWSRLSPKITIPLAVAYMAMNYILVLAYSQASVALANTLWQSSAIFVYVLTILLFGEKLMLMKVVSVIVGIVGVVFMGVGNSGDERGANESGGNAALGFFFGLCAALLAACFNVAFKRFARSQEDTIGMMGWIGVWHLLLLWIGILVDANALDLPQQWWPLPTIVLIAFIVNSLTMYTIVLAGPVFVSVGSALTVPFSFVADNVVHGSDGTSEANSLTVGGLFLVFLSFITLNIADLLHKRLNFLSSCEWAPTKRAKPST